MILIPERFLIVRSAGTYALFASGESVGLCLFDTKRSAHSIFKVFQQRYGVADTESVSYEAAVQLAKSLSMDHVVIHVEGQSQIARMWLAV